MGLNFGIITRIGADHGNWCFIAIFLFLLWFVTFLLLMYRIELCKKLKKKLKYGKKKEDNTSEEV